MTAALVAARARETTTCSALVGFAGTSSPQISSTRDASDRPRGPASARPRSSAWVRSPGTGSPFQVTSSRTVSRVAGGPSTLDGTGPLGGERDGGVTGGRRLLLGERAVGCPEPERERQRLAALAHLVAGEDVEEPDRLQEVAGALAQRRLDLRRGDVGGDDQRDVLLRERVGGEL